MKPPSLLSITLFSICFSIGVFSQTGAASAPADKSRPDVRVCTACIRAHMEFLASDALRGRGSGTADELVAATYIASQLRAYGIAPAGDNGSYIQQVALLQPKFTAPPQLTWAGTGENKFTWTYGKEFTTVDLSQARFSGPLHVINTDEEDSNTSGSIVLILGNDRRKQRARASTLADKGAVAVIVAVNAERAAQNQKRAAELPSLPPILEGQGVAGLVDNFNLLETSPEATKILEALPENAMLNFDGASSSEESSTRNVVGMLRGNDPVLRHSALLLSAHLDHLGIGTAVNGDNIYNGADDDASGTTAVLEMARVLGSGPRPKRTVIFALFGSEETGGQGAAFFAQHPPVPLQQIVANLEFEMLGRADPAVAADAVWLTGWERSNLGPSLASHGGSLVADPHLKQNFFARSDNYVLAKKGVVAQTVSSYGLHGDYHEPSDDVAHIDFKHMDAAIGSLVRTVSWLANSSFTPQWNPGGKP
jgi:aminopeptidase YwaD